MSREPKKVYAGWYCLKCTEHGITKKSQENHKCNVEKKVRFEKEEVGG